MRALDSVSYRTRVLPASLLSWTVVSKKVTKM